MFRIAPLIDVPCAPIDPPRVWPCAGASCGSEEQTDRLEVPRQVQRIAHGQNRSRIHNATIELLFDILQELTHSFLPEEKLGRIRIPAPRGDHVKIGHFCLAHHIVEIDHAP